MFRILDRVLTVLAILALAGCSAPESLTRPVEGRPPAAPATATRPPATAKPPLPVAGANNVAPTEQPTRFLLADGGPYHAGRRTVRYEDAGRHNRQVSVTVWYPAMPPEETAETSLQVGAELPPGARLGPVRRLCGGGDHDRRG